jgi:hypothetical protein
MKPVRKLEARGLEKLRMVQRRFLPFHVAFDPHPCLSVDVLAMFSERWEFPDPFLLQSNEGAFVIFAIVAGVDRSLHALRKSEQAATANASPDLNAAEQEFPPHLEKPQQMPRRIFLQCPQQYPHARLFSYELREFRLMQNGGGQFPLDLSLDRIRLFFPDLLVAGTVEEKKE